MHKKLVVFIVLFMCVPFTNAKKQRVSVNETQIHLFDNTTHLDINIRGGAFVNFQTAGSNVNPFDWKVEKTQMPQNNQSGADFQGHFLCTGRWGKPTDGEVTAGVPHNGQAARDKWKISKKSSTSATMYIKAPLDGVNIKRTVTLLPGVTGFMVCESFHNYRTTGRLFNVVQHATIGGAFLTDDTFIESNAQNGFMQHISYPDPHKHAYRWPMAYNSIGTDSIDLRRSDTPESYVSTHVFSDSIGWIAASSKSTGLTIVYIWKTNEYPWLNLWHQRINGYLWAKGLEFGTTGVGQSYQDLLNYNTRFYGRNSFFFLDAGETIKKSYYCFLLKKDYKDISVKISELITRFRVDN